MTHLQVAEAALRVEDAEARARRFTDLIARKVAADEEWTVAERIAARAQTGWVTRQRTAAVATLVRASGAGSLYREVPIHRVHQDLQAAARHAFGVLSVNLETYGRTLVGLEPNSAFRRPGATAPTGPGGARPGPRPRGPVNVPRRRSPVSRGAGPPTLTGGPGATRRSVPRRAAPPARQRRTSR